MAALEGFQHYHNVTRPHQGHACGNRPPNEAYPEVPILPHPPEEVDPDAWLMTDHNRSFRRRISSSGTIQIDKHTYYIDQELAGSYVLVHLNAESREFAISLNGVYITTKAIRGLFGEKMDFQSYLIAMKHEARTLERRRNALWRQRGEGA